MAEAAVGALLPVVGRIGGALGSDYLKTHVSGFFGFKDDLKALMNSVAQIEASLSDANEEFFRSNQGRVWVRNLKAALQEAEDLIDKISTAAWKQEMKGNKISQIFSLSHPLLLRLRLGSKLKKIRENIDGFCRVRPLHLEFRTITARAEVRRSRRVSFIRDEEIIGRNGAKSQIVQRVLEGEGESGETVSVLPIVGIGGIGKTTVARLVFNDEMIKKLFDARFWVNVGNVFDLKSILRQLLGTDGRDGAETKEEDELLAGVRERVDGIRFLIVLDDVWSDNNIDLKPLQSVFKGGAKGSTVLVTTRSSSVSERMRTSPAYTLDELSKDDAVTLFRRSAFRRGEEDCELMSIGLDILEKCKGNPLAILSMGNLLFGKDDKKQWLQVRDQQLSTLTQHENEIIPILRMSFESLDYHTKQLFTYCSIFPKGYRIGKDELVQHWIAQGYIRSDTSRHLEDVGEDYVLELIGGNFFHDLKKDTFGSVISFKMHDLIHDVALSIAQQDYTSWDGRIHGGLHVWCDSLKHLRQLLRDWPSEGKKLRTVICSPESDLVSISDKDIIGLRHLRVLVLPAWKGILRLPNSINHLQYLRELDLSDSWIVELPSSIVELPNLLFLKLSGCKELQKLPRDIGKLRKLRTLDITRCWSLWYMPKGIGSLSSLHTLPRFVLSTSSSSEDPQASLCDLSGLNNLSGELEIVGLGSPNEAVDASRPAHVLIKKQWLRKLTLTWFATEGDRSGFGLLQSLQPHENLEKLKISVYPGLEFPGWMASGMIRYIPNLVEFYLSNCSYLQQLPAALGELPSLRIMELNNLPMVNRFEGNNSSTVSGMEPFPRLARLVVNGCRQLTSLPFPPQLEVLQLYNSHHGLLTGQRICHRLKQLSITNMLTLEEVPKEWLQGLSALETMIVRHCPALQALPLGGELINLNRLEVIGCPVLDVPVDLLQVTNLRDLNISGMQKLRVLPGWVFQSTKLEILYLQNLSNLVAIPGKIGDLKQLRSIRISGCPNIFSLPEEMSQLTCLEYLTIENCFALERACGKTGPDRSHIAHVGRIEIRTNSSTGDYGHRLLGTHDDQVTRWW